MADPKSEAIRLSLGLLTPAERQALADREARAGQESARVATLGVPLLELEP